MTTKEKKQSKVPSRGETKAWFRKSGGRRILLVTRSRSILSLLRETLTGTPYQLDLAVSSEGGVQQLERVAEYDLAVFQDMPGTMDGEALVEAVRERQPALPLMLISWNPRLKARLDNRTGVRVLDFPLERRAFQDELEGTLGR